MNSAGSAEQENAIYMESLEGKLKKLNSAWQSFSTNTVNSDFIKKLLDVATNLIKIADAAGGLTPILATLIGTFALFKAGSMAKGITELIDKFSKFRATVQELGGGFRNFQLVLAGVKTAEDAAKISTVGLAVSAQTLTAALGIIGVVLGIATTAYNLFINKQNEARQASIDNANTHLEEANSLKKKAEEEDNNITKLENEKKALEKLSNVDDGTKEKIENKQKEIDKRKENIQKIKEEQKAEAKKAVGDVSGQKGQNTAGGIHAYIKTGVEAEDKKLAGYVKDFNVAIKEADGNTGKYNKTIDDMKTKYSELLSQQKENGEAYKATDKFLQLLNREQQKNADNYEKDAKLAEVYYNALMNGLTEAQAGQDMVDWMQEFYGLSEEQMEQLEQGIDVKKTDAESTDTQTEAQQKLNEALEDAQKKQSDYDSIVDDSINKLVSYSDNVSLLTQAQDMLTDSGHLTAEMYQQLANNDLLQYLDVVNGKLQVNKDAFDGSSQAALDNATQAVKDSLAQELLQIALADQNGTLNETATKLGLVKSKSEGVDTTNAVEQILKIGSAASTSKAELGALFKTMEQGKEVNADYTPSSGAANLMNQAIDRANKKIAAIKSISLGSFKSSGSGKKSGSGSSKKSGSRSSKKVDSDSKKSTKSTKEEYKATIDTLYKYKNALDNAKDSVDKLQDTLKNTDNYNEQEKYIKQLIAALDEEIKKTQDLKNAQSNQIKDYINQLRKQGFSIDYNSSKNELYIKNMEHLGSLSGDNAKKTEKLLDKIQDLNDNNRSLDSSIRDLKKDTKDYYKQLADIPEAKLKKFNELMKDFQQNRLDQIQNQIDDIEHEMKNDPRLQQLEKQIEALEKQNDEVDKQKDLEEKLLAIEEAKEKLANAKNQKTLQVYRKGQGFVWEADPTAIKEAQEELDSAQGDLDEQQKQDQIDDLKAEKEAIEKGYQDKIDALQNFLDEQNYQIDKAGREGIQTLDQLRQELAKYGLDNAEYLGKATEWLNKYNSALKETKGTLDTISSNSATDGTLYSSFSQNRLELAKSTLRFKSILSEISSASRKVAYDKLSGGNNQNVYISNVELPNVKNANEFVEALKNLPRLAASQATIRT